MRERPVLMSAPMVRAILSGVKTQTRRIIKPQPERRHVVGVGPLLAFIKKPVGPDYWIWPNAREEVLAMCPYGQPGDRLWVREAFCYCADVLPNDGRPVGPDGRGCLYRATDSEAVCADSDDERPPKWTPSIHMPQWASRITLEITGVRVERLQAIDDRDAIREGAEQIGDCEGAFIAGFHTLWESLNGPGSWEANPWVWVIEFRRI